MEDTVIVVQNRTMNLLQVIELQSLFRMSQLGTRDYRFPIE